jgi:hypothetical protein
LVSKDEEAKPKHIQVNMTEGGNEFVCYHKSHKGERYVITGDHDEYQRHLATHGKKQLGAAPCMRCGKEANMNLDPTIIGTKPMCSDCIKWQIAQWTKEGRIKL